jgi:hypothetical protein
MLLLSLPCLNPYKFKLLGNSLVLYLEKPSYKLSVPHLRLAPDSLQVAFKQADRLHHHSSVVASQTSYEEMTIKLVGLTILERDMVRKREEIRH